MLHRTAQLSYANLHDYWRWDLTSPNDGARFPRSVRWRTSWFLETAFPEANQNVLYIGFDRRMDFEMGFIRKSFAEKWEGSVTFLLANSSQNNIDLAPPNFEIIYRPLELDLPFEDAYFDRIYCANVLNFIPPHQHPQYLREMARLLTPNGMLCVATAYFGKAQIHPDTQEISRFARIPQYAPNVKNWLDSLNIPYPYNAVHFPGFPTFNEDALLQAEDLLIDDMERFPPLQERDPSLLYTQIGLSITPSPI